ncbi:putative holin [Providencia rettgeri]
MCQHFFSRYRLVGWWFSALVLLVLIAVFSPQQLGVVLYKLALVCVAVVLGYALDRALFPYASPGSYLRGNWKQDTPYLGVDEAEFPVVQGYQRIFAAALLRRAVIVLAVVLGMTLGL